MKIIYSDSTLSQCPEDRELSVLRHTAAHILAQAVKRLYPHARFAYGPATDNGFYYDIDTGHTRLSEEDLPAIEREMEKIAGENLPIRPFTLPRSEAIAYMESRGEIYKAEHIGDLPPDSDISFYQQGEYVDMCTGPHLCHTKGLKAFHLTGLSGAYWKNDSRNPMLTRIHGIAFATRQALETYLQQLEEARKRDHRRIGKEMELFLFCEEAPGFPFFLPKGVTLKNTLIDFWRSLHTRCHYTEISTPMIMHRQLWETSGHWEHYKNNMYATAIDGEAFCIKPMNCPGSVLVYKSRPRSHRELPLRMGELGLVHRHEMKGALHGLFRVRCFTQDDAHIFLRREQIRQEISDIVALIDGVYRRFGFSYSLELSTRPENSMGSDADWDAATRGLMGALEEMHLPYTVNPGDGAFYGPKIDFHLEDSLGRTWQCGTIQLDFQMPINFDLSYIDEKGEKQRPIMIHRVCFGSLERFMGILTEHYAGKFPLWLAPVQARILPISEKSAAYAREICLALQAEHIRCEMDDSHEKIGALIRQAQFIDRVPYMVIIGQKEAEDHTVSLRSRDTGKTETMTPEALIQKITAENRYEKPDR